MGDHTPFAPWLDNWGLIPDGEPFQTRYNRNWLMPVRRGDTPAMLKIAPSEHERRGAALMAWLAGDGAARVLALEGDALLLERLPAARCLADMARAGRDDEAMRILCAVGDRLHAPRARSLPEGLIPLESWFRALAPAAAAHGGVLEASLSAAAALLADQRGVCLLHGDLHHENVLDGGERGWLLIDPKGLFGERTYEYATTLCNPDEALALSPGRLARQAEVIATAAQLDRERLLRWTLAHAGVSAAWCMADGFDPAPALAIAEVARAELARVRAD
ncbi:MAG TPA: aminoglycoside phosphotransferase family protein [Phenylobacterium sp.]|jgi:streptomycin 6-kinase